MTNTQNTVATEITVAQAEKLAGKLWNSDATSEIRRLLVIHELEKMIGNVKVWVVTSNGRDMFAYDVYEIELEKLIKAQSLTGRSESRLHDALATLASEMCEGLRVSGNVNKAN